MTTYININGDVREASSLNVPTDRTFRGAWQFNGDAVEIYMTAALAIHKDTLRAESKTRIDHMYIDFMQALEAVTSTTQFATVIATLRVITDDARLAAATTPYAL